MKCIPASAALAVAISLAGTPAQAQLVVHDPAAVAQLISQAQTALSQLQSLRDQLTEAKRLYDSFNELSDVNGLAQSLLSDELRRFVPDLDRLHAAAKGDLAALGELAERAKALREGARIHAPLSPTPADEALEAAGARAARDLALAEKVADVADGRLGGLEDLREALGRASSARAAMDIGARAAVEQAIIANDQVRLQGLMMMQAAEARAESQRREEAAAAAHATLIATFQRGFDRP